jgi:hypothetical protein
MTRSIEPRDVTTLIRLENAIADALRMLRETGNDGPESDPIAVAGILAYRMRVNAERIAEIDAINYALS